MNFLDEKGERERVGYSNIGVSDYLEIAKVLR